MQKHALLMAETAEISKHLFNKQLERTIQQNKIETLDIDADERPDGIGQRRRHRGERDLPHDRLRA